MPGLPTHNDDATAGGCRGGVGLQGYLPHSLHLVFAVQSGLLGFHAAHLALELTHVHLQAREDFMVLWMY